MLRRSGAAPVRTGQVGQVTGLGARLRPLRRSVAALVLAFLGAGPSR